MLIGRLGLDKARVPHADRHGLIWLDRGRLEVEDGCLHFVTAGGTLAAGDYQIPHQSVSIGLALAVLHWAYQGRFSPEIRALWPFETVRRDGGVDVTLNRCALHRRMVRG